MFCMVLDFVEQSSRYNYKSTQEGLKSNADGFRSHNEGFRVIPTEGFRSQEGFRVQDDRYNSKNESARDLYTLPMKDSVINSESTWDTGHAWKIACICLLSFYFVVQI